MPIEKKDAGFRFWRRWIDRIGGRSRTSDNKSYLTPSPPPRQNGTSGSFPDTRQRVAEDISEFENKLRQIANARPVITAGKVQLLNIEPISRKLGARWPKIAERAHLKIENILGRYLGRRDIFRRHKDFLYIVVFAEIGGGEAKALMSMISAEIERVLGDGDPELAALELRVASFEMGGKVVLEAYHPSDAVGDFIAFVERDGKSASHQTIGDDNGSNSSKRKQSLKSDPAKDKKIREIERVHEMIKQRLDNFTPEVVETPENTKELKLLRDIEDELFRLHDRIARRVPLVKKTVQNTGAKSALLKDDEGTGYPRPATILLMEAENAFIAGKPDARVFRDEGNNLSLTFSYRPAWHIKQSVLGTYFSTAYFQEGEVRRATEFAFQNRMGEDINALIDRCHLRRVLLDLEGLGGEISAFVCIPIHFSTLRHTSHRQTLQYLLHTIPQWCRSVITWEVIDAPPDAMKAQIEDVVSLLKPFGHDIFWRTNGSLSALKSFKSSPVRTVGFSINAFHGNEERLMRVIDSWLEEAEKLRFQTYVRAANSRSLVVSAVCAGVGRISGDAVATPVENLRGMRSFSEEQLYTKLLSDAVQR